VEQGVAYPLPVGDQVEDVERGTGYELQRGVFLEERHHVPGVLQQRVDPRLVVLLT
jgi:hypothetical protein